MLGIKTTRIGAALLADLR